MFYVHRLRPALSALLVLGAALTVSACDSEEPEPEPERVVPTFRVASVTITDDGTQFLQFAARPDLDVELSSVLIENPAGSTASFNAQNSLVLANEAIALQASDVGYFRVSGEWSFRFTGIDDGGAGERFTTTTTINVGALAPAPPTE